MARETARGNLGWLRSLIFATVIGSLLFVTSREMREGRLPVIAVPDQAECNAKPAELSTQAALVTKRLLQAGLPLSAPVEETQGAGSLRWVHRLYEVEVSPMLDLKGLEEKLLEVTAHDPCVAALVTPMDAGAHVRIGIGGLLTHTLMVRWATVAMAGSRLAIVVGGLGDDLLVARRLAAIEAPIVFAVVPFRPFSKEVAALASFFNREVMLDLTTADEGGQGTSEGELHLWLDQAAAGIPHVIGVSSGRASLLSRDVRHMIWLLGWLKARQLFLVGRLTTGESVIEETVAALGIPIASSMIFLEKSPDEERVHQQLSDVASRVGRQGSVLSIEHDHETALGSLRAVLPQWHRAGVNVVPISTLVAVPNLAGE